jgi:hypothetical protein
MTSHCLIARHARDQPYRQLRALSQRGEGRLAVSHDRWPARIAHIPICGCVAQLIDETNQSVHGLLHCLALSVTPEQASVIPAEGMNIEPCVVDQPVNRVVEIGPRWFACGPSLVKLLVSQRFESCDDIDAGHRERLPDRARPGEYPIARSGACEPTPSGDSAAPKCFEKDRSNGFRVLSDQPHGWNA